MTLEQDFEDFVALLNKHKVDYLVIGGYALAFHGRPRNTGDLDIWIDISEKNAEKMVRVVNEFGFSSLGFTKGDFMKANNIAQLGYPPLRIDVLTSIDGIEFKDAVTNKKIIDVDGLSVQYIGLKDFIINKESSGRKQDLDDIKEIKKNQSMKKSLLKSKKKGKRL